MFGGVYPNHLVGGFNPFEQYLILVKLDHIPR